MPPSLRDPANMRARIRIRRIVGTARVVRAAGILVQKKRSININEKEMKFSECRHQ
jgi:hypothetical protein